MLDECVIVNLLETTNIELVLYELNLTLIL